MIEKVYRLLEDAANLVERTIYDYDWNDEEEVDIGEVRVYCRGIITALCVMGHITDEEYFEWYNRFRE